MTIRRFITSAIAAIAFTVASAGAVLAQVQTNMIVIDLPLLMNQAVAAQSLQRQLDQANQINEAAIGPKRTAVQAKQAQLRDERANLSAADFEARRTALQQEIDELSAEVQQRKGTLEGRMRNAMGQIRSQIEAIAGEIAVQRGANIVVSKNAVIIMDPRFDITADALKILNERLPTVDLQ